MTDKIYTSISDRDSITNCQEKEQVLLTKALQYPEGRLVARGVIILSPQQSEPYGFTSAGDLDPAFTSDTASLFILGVGREGITMDTTHQVLKTLFPDL